MAALLSQSHQDLPYMRMVCAHSSRCKVKVQLETTGLCFLDGSTKLQNWASAGAVWESAAMCVAAR